MLLCWHGNNLSKITIIRLLLSHPKIDVNNKNEYKQTALMFLCLHGSMKVIKILLQHPNIDINMKDEDGRTALHYLLSTNLNFDEVENNREIVGLLKSYGAK